MVVVWFFILVNRIVFVGCFFLYIWCIVVFCSIGNGNGYIFQFECFVGKVGNVYFE